MSTTDYFDADTLEVGSVDDDTVHLFRGAALWPPTATPKTWLMPGWKGFPWEACEELDVVGCPYEVSDCGDAIYVHIPETNVVGAAILDNVPHAVGDTDYFHQMLTMPFSCGQAAGGLHGSNVGTAMRKGNGAGRTIGKAIAGNPLTLPFVAIFSLFRKGA